MERTANAATAALEKDKAAYRKRANDLAQLRKRCKTQANEISSLTDLAWHASDLLDLEQERAAAARAEAAASSQRAEAAEAQQRKSDSALARELESTARTKELTKELAIKDKELASKSCALQKAAAQVEALRGEIARLQICQAPDISERRVIIPADRSMRRWAQKDTEYLTSVFKEWEWDPKHLAKALANANLLQPVFDTECVWELRLQWVRSAMMELGKTVWSVESTIGLMIDAVLSYGDLQRLRQAFSLQYDAQHDRCMHRVWLSNPRAAPPDEDSDEDDKTVGRLLRQSRHAFVRLPEPVPPIEKVRNRFKEIEGDLKIEVSSDGRIATHRFMYRLVDLHEEHKALGLIEPWVGGTADSPHVVTYCLDAFPVEAVSVEHTGIFSSSLKVPSQSESFFRITTAATIKETNSELNRMHTMRRIDRDFNLVSTKGHVKGQDGKPIHFVLVVCMDKKAVEWRCSEAAPQAVLIAYGAHARGRSGCLRHGR